MSLALSASLLSVLVLAPPVRPASAAPEKEKSFNEVTEGLQFRNIGPFRGGRACAVTGVRGQPFTWYFGATGGGVWKTTDGGASWDNVSDKDFKTGSVGSLAVAESDPNVVYAGMGEWTIRGNVSHGDGVYKSTDAGLSWTNVGLKSTYQIAKVLVDPKNADVVYVAAQGHAWGPNDDRGVFRSQDGGKTWKKVLFVNAHTGASDLAMDPTNPRILYAGMWEGQRFPWTFTSGGTGSGLYKTTDGGENWSKLTDGLPEGVVGKVGVGVSASHPSRVWAFVEAEKGGVFRSDDAGKKWTRVNGEHKVRERAWYYSRVYVDPHNDNVVYVPNVVFHRSVDGGKTFASWPVPHGDNHEMWIDPDDPDRIIVGNDGGATITFNGGRTWSTQDNQPTAQFYRVAVDDQFPYWVYGSQQDNSNVAIPSGVPGRGIEASDWHPVGGGESGWIAPDLRDPNIVYAGEYGGQITRYDHRTRQAREVMAWPQLADGHGAKDLKYRFQWNAPIVMSTHDPAAVYHASQILLRSRDGGEHWEEVSPDLTRNDRSKQEPAGGPIAKDSTGVEVYDTIFALAESRLEAGTIWAGSDDGLVHLTRDDGKTWKNVTPRGLPEWAQINAIDASPHDKATAYVAATRYKLDDFQPLLYKTNDYGATWTAIGQGIPAGAFTRVVREDPGRRGLLYAGTETGLFVSFDDGATWRSFQRNLPATPVTDLVVKNGDLVVATQGRGFWILDDLSSLRAWNDEVRRAEVRLFKPRPAMLVRVTAPDADEPAPVAVGKNMPAGLIVDFWLKDKPKDTDKVTLEFLAAGHVLRTFTNQKDVPASDEDDVIAEPDADKEKPLDLVAGLNRFEWDMRILKPTLVPKAVFNEGTKQPPKVAPGAYEVRLTVGDRVLTEKAEVRPQPGITATAEDLQAQYELLTAIRDRLSETHETVLRIHDLKAQVKGLSDRMEKRGKGAELAPRAKALAASLNAVEDKLWNPHIKADEDDLNYEPKLDHELTNLAGLVASADARPTPGTVAYFALLKDRLTAIEGELAKLVETDVPAFNQLAQAAGATPVVALPPPAAGGR
jgi:photosystem II stability/assembly factor-like uncharacterized protein